MRRAGWQAWRVPPWVGIFSRRAIFVKGVLLAALLAGGAEAQPSLSCQDEIRSLRWLVREYAEQRGRLELGLATSEARRQAAEERLKPLEDALKSAPTGHK